MIGRETLFGEAHLGRVARAANAPFVLLIWAYRYTLSPVIGRQCRFEPTCSRFSLGAFRRYGPLKGLWMTTARVCRCHPFHPGGYDPVPARPDGPSEHSLDCASNGKRGPAR